MLWDWSAAYLGLGPAEGVFLPGYWRLTAGLTRLFGFLPPPGLVLACLVGVMLVLWSAQFWLDRKSPQAALFVLSGFLIADTPYVAVLPLAASLTTLLIARIGAERRVKLFRTSLSGIRQLRALALGFMSGVLLNFVSSGVEYVPGYFRNALAAFRDVGVRHPLVAMKMDRLLDRYVEEIVAEAGACDWIFTDGVCDAGIASAAWRCGRTLRTIPLIGSGADGTCASWAGLVRPGDQLALRTGSGELLRSWAVDHPDRLKQAAFQCGFAFLKQTVGEALENAGLVKRIAPVSVTERDRAAHVLTALAEDVCGFCRRDGAGQGGRRREMRFHAMQWCVAEALRRMVEERAHAGQSPEAKRMLELVRTLDEDNPVLENRRSAMSLSSAVAACALTPREGLRLTLRHADFALARSFALKVLKEDAHDVEANFALGMDCFRQRKFAEARHYLLRALAGRPKEPALLNNIALASLELRDLASAEKYAREAAALAPGSHEVKDTLSRVKAAVGRPR